MTIFKHMQNVYFAFLLLLNITILLLSLYFSFERYNSYIFGKYDLGNMNQMLFNSARGNFMQLTDYFGSNVSRFSMSHVDPSLLIFIPISWFISDAWFLFVAQNILFALSCYLIYKIGILNKLSKLESLAISSIFLLMPITQYILVWTTFHPPAIALFSLVFVYYFLHKQVKVSINIKIILLYVFSALFILSKEELGIVWFFVCVFLYSQFKDYKKHLIVISAVSFLWSLACFLFIIPLFAHERIESLKLFLNSAGLSEIENYKELTSENYFIYRYKDLGDSYTKIVQNIILDPFKLVFLIFSPQNIDTLIKFFLPVLFVIIQYPLLVLVLVPELAIQMLSGSDEVFSITNHRLMVLIPVLIFSLVLFTKKLRLKNTKYSTVFVATVLLFNIFLGVLHQAPVTFAVYDKIENKVISLVFANKSSDVEFDNNIDSSCSDYLINELKGIDKVSVPQPFGAKTSNRQFNAMFPAGLVESNSFVADVYDRKIVDFINVSTDYNRKLVNNAFKNKNFGLQSACNRFMLFSDRLTKNWNIEQLQSPNLEFNNSYKLLDNSYYITSDLSLNADVLNAKYTYFIGEENNKENLFIYTILQSSNQAWSYVHMPSLYIKTIASFPANSYITESFSIKVPNYLKKGAYKIYFGIGDRKENNINVYVGEIKL